MKKYVFIIICGLLFDESIYKAYIDNIIFLIKRPADSGVTLTNVLLVPKHLLPQSGWAIAKVGSVL